MSLLTNIKRAFVGDPGEPAVLDHMPVTGGADWREAKLAEAARRHGKAWKCGPDSLPHEVMVVPQFYVVKCWRIVPEDEQDDTNGRRLLADAATSGGTS